MTDDEMKVVFELRKALADQGLTAIELANRTGLSRQAIYNLQRYPQAIRLDSLAAICAALEKQPGDLLKLVPVR